MKRLISVPVIRSPARICLTICQHYAERVLTGATIRLRTSESSYSKSGKSSFRLMSSIVDSHMVAVNEEEKWDSDRVLSTLHNDALSNTVDAFERAHFTSLSDLMSTYKQCLDASLRKMATQPARRFLRKAIETHKLNPKIALDSYVIACLRNKMSLQAISFILNFYSVYECAPAIELLEQALLREIEDFSNTEAVYMWITFIRHEYDVEFSAEFKGLVVDSMLSSKDPEDIKRGLALYGFWRENPENIPLKVYEAVILYFGRAGDVPSVMDTMEEVRHQCFGGSIPHSCFYAYMKALSLNQSANFAQALAEMEKRNVPIDSSTVWRTAVRMLSAKQTDNIVNLINIVLHSGMWAKWPAPDALGFFHQLIHTLNNQVLRPDISCLMMVDALDTLDRTAESHRDLLEQLKPLMLKSIQVAARLGCKNECRQLLEQLHRHGQQVDLTTLSACVANASGPENEELAKLWFENYHATAHCRSCYHDVASALLALPRGRQFADELSALKRRIFNELTRYDPVHNHREILPAYLEMVMRDNPSNASFWQMDVFPVLDGMLSSRKGKLVVRIVLEACRRVRDRLRCEDVCALLRQLHSRNAISENIVRDIVFDCCQVRDVEALSEILNVCAELNVNVDSDFYYMCQDALNGNVEKTKKKLASGISPADSWCLMRCVISGQRVQLAEAESMIDLLPKDSENYSNVIALLLDTCRTVRSEEVQRLAGKGNVWNETVRQALYRALARCGDVESVEEMYIIDEKSWNNSMRVCALNARVLGQCIRENRCGADEAMKMLIRMQAHISPEVKEMYQSLIKEENELHFVTGIAR